MNKADIKSKKKAGSVKRRQTKMALALFSMMVPGLVYLIINNYIPMAGLIIAFKRFDYSKGIWGSDWVGLSNFTYLFKTQDAFNIVRNTVGYNLTFIFLGNLLAVTVAIMLNNLRGTMNKKLYQTIILIPYLISMVVVSYIVFGFLSQENGFLNKMISSLGGHPISWYTTSKYWPVIFTVINLWKGFGYNSILYYATVIGIDSSLYEAALVDGANRWQQIWHVTLPGLKSTIITMVLLAIGRMFYSDFGLFYQVPMRSGLISSVTDTIDVFVYKGLTQLNDIGRASAAGFLQSVLGFILVLTANFIVRKIDEENALF
ncbi:MAG: ABC transporter permease subunit [Lachnospiraceae bacterium]|nr:ABC transporter permease subunit [Lachnospiraceae bacterium]MCM1236749.1 ABC transporter permease subunit [Ruminococcus flavefaciens]